MNPVQIISPELIAFDFDGVICDGLLEYFQTAWIAYCQLFEPSIADPTGQHQIVQIDPVSFTYRPPAGLAEKFYALRPVVETGWEMPVLIKALIAGASEAQILAQWPLMGLPYLAAAGLSQAQSVQALDGVRDRWIQADLPGWLSLHRFYPGLIARLDKLMAMDLPLYIVSTKEGRFISQLLFQSGLDFPETQIFGKEVKRPKYETLRLLKDKHAVSHIWFVEDRLPALAQVKAQADLTEVRLFLADWGYNLAGDRATASEDSRIHLLSLDQVVQPFDQWI
jgi:phosphoglycolate phosphatase-like HAD superfamily hydrolase